MRSGLKVPGFSFFVSDGFGGASACRMMRMVAFVGPCWATAASLSVGEAWSLAYWAGKPKGPAAVEPFAPLSREDPGRRAALAGGWGRSVSFEELRGADTNRCFRRCKSSNVLIPNAGFQKEFRLIC